MNFKGFSKETVDFLWGIRLNNDRAWYAAHKQQCKEVLVNPMNALAQDVLDALHACGFTVTERHEHGGWLCLVCRQ